MEKAASVDDIGFKMSEQTNIRAMLGRSFNTSFLMGGMFDHIVVKDTAMDEGLLRRKLTNDLPQEAMRKLQEAYDALTLSGIDNCKSNRLGEDRKHGAAIDWTSDNPDVITDESKQEGDL